MGPSLYARLMSQPSRRYTSQPVHGVKLRDDARARSPQSVRGEGSAQHAQPALGATVHETAAYPESIELPKAIPAAGSTNPSFTQPNGSTLIKPGHFPSHEDSSDSDSEDVFYTPLSSPRNSLAAEEMRFSSLGHSSRSPSSSTAPSISSFAEDSLFGHSAGSLPLSESTRRTSVRGYESPPNKGPGQYTDADWAQDALSPQRPTEAASSRRHSASVSAASSSSSSRPRHRTKKNGPTGAILMSMTAVLEEDEGENTRPSGSVHIVHPAGNVMPRIETWPSPVKTRSTAGSSTLSHRRAKTLGHVDAFSVYESAHSGEMDQDILPTQSALPSHGTQGYTSLVLPRAPQPLAISRAVRRNSLIPSNKVDLTRSNVAQTTMATVEVVRGLGSNPSALRSSGSARRTANISRSFRFGSASRDDAPNGALPLGFTSHRPPPTVVPSGSVLVQCWAVAVDGVDQRLVGVDGLALSPASTLSGERSPKPPKKQIADVGFCPGRSFVGRVMESGWEVREDVYRRGDWVAGLLDVRKSGALAEFILVDRHRIHRVPHPRMTPTQDPHPTPSLEELSLIPLCGVPAHRAVRTLAFALENQGTPDPLRALVLCGHDGPGALAAQMLIRRGWSVVVHVPGYDQYGVVELDDDNSVPGEIERRIMSWGSQDVIFDESSGAVSTIAGLTELGEVFDGIIDTIGGKEIWHAGEQLLLRGEPGSSKQFTTLVGDAPERAVPSAKDYFRSGLRSWKGGDGKGKQRPQIGYAWVSVGSDVDWEGHDVGVAIEETLACGVRPFVRKVVPFERAPQAFDDPALAVGGTVVFRVVDT